MLEDTGLAKTSHYDWMNIEVNQTRVGKMRVRAADHTLIIYSITIFPEFQLHGYAGKVIHSFQDDYQGIVADRVRDTAKGFWQKMGFNDDGKGNYVWQRDMAMPSTGAHTPAQRSEGSGG